MFSTFTDTIEHRAKVVAGRGPARNHTVLPLLLLEPDLPAHTLTVPRAAASQPLRCSAVRHIVGVAGAVPGRQHLRHQQPYQRWKPK